MDVLFEFAKSISKLMEIFNRLASVVPQLKDLALPPNCPDFVFPFAGLISLDQQSSFSFYVVEDRM